jgi:hypothetical protein
MESSNGMNAAQDNLSSPELTPHVSSAPEPVSSNDRSFNKSEVNDIVRRAKSEAIESYRRQQVQQPDYVAQKYGDVGQATKQPQTPYSNGQAPSEDHIRQIVADETQRQREAWQNETRQRTEAEQAQAIVNKFYNKISTGKEKYQDFDKVTGDIEFGRFPNTVQLLAEHIDNSADVLYELGKDRFKMAQLESLAYLSPKDAIIQAQRLATSIKENEQAAKVRLPNEPISQMRPSIAGVDSGTQLSFRDLKNKYKG